MSETPQRYLTPTRFIDSDHEIVRDFVGEVTKGVADPVEAAVRLYYRVRDDLRYEPYRFSIAPEAMTASSALERKDGFCVPKAITLAAAGRAAGIPTRLGFADVRNHLATKKLLDWLTTDLFIYHGYMEFFLEGRWVKATPAFNLSLCEKFGVVPLDFDGHHDSVFHPCDNEGRLHMEYITDRGTFDDLPYEELNAACQTAYPFWGQAIGGDFALDAAREQRAG